MKQKNILLLFFVFTYLTNQAQVWFYVNDTLEVPITAETKKEHIKTFLEADSVEKLTKLWLNR